MKIFTARKSKYSDLRRRRRFRSISINRNVVSLPSNNNIFKGVFALLLIPLLIYLLLVFLTSDSFKVSETVIIGSRVISKEEIDTEIAEVFESSLFFVNTHKIEQQIMESFPTFKSVTVRKFLPNKLSITITEKEPILFYLNLSGVYLIDEDGVVSEIIYQDIINFGDNQLKIITGEEGIDSSLVFDRLKSDYLQTQEDVPEEEQLEFDIETVTLDRKFAVLASIQKELFEQAIIIIKSNESNVDFTTLPALSPVYVFNNLPLEKGDSIDLNRLDITKNILAFFLTERASIRETLWEGRYNVKIITEDGKIIVFGTNRNISEQLEDYNIIVEQLNREEKFYTEIDLTSRKVSVK